VSHVFNAQSAKPAHSIDCNWRIERKFSGGHHASGPANAAVRSLPQRRKLAAVGFDEILPQGIALGRKPRFDLAVRGFFFGPYFTLFSSHRGFVLLAKQEAGSCIKRGSVAVPLDK
jgi:hypothetical protein